MEGGREKGKEGGEKRGKGGQRGERWGRERKGESKEYESPCANMEKFPPYIVISGERKSYRKHCKIKCYTLYQTKRNKVFLQKNTEKISKKLELEWEKIFT